MAAHRYWRLFIYETTGSNCFVGELQFREVAGVNQVPSGGMPMASSVRSISQTYQAINAFDGNNATYWEAIGNNKEWIGYDFGAGNEIEPVEILIGARTFITSGNPVRCTVDYSDDGISWNTYFALDALTGWTVGQNKLIPVDLTNQENRITQLQVISVITDGPGELRFTQIPILTVTLPVQPVRFTQIPVLSVDHYKPVPFPVVLVPELPLSETWEWKTTVNIKDNGQEQRGSLRETPRQRLALNFLTLNNEDYRRAYDLLWKAQGKEFLYPLYQYGAFLEPAELGDTRLYFDPKLTDIRSGDKLALFSEHTGETTYLDSSTVEIDGVTLAEPLGFDIGASWQICPALPFRFLSPGSMSLSGVSGSMSMMLEMVGPRQFQRVDSGHLLTIYDGFIVLDKRPLAPSDNEYSRNVNWIDSGTGLPKSETKWRDSFTSGRRSFIFNRYQNMDYWRAFMDLARGRQKSFLHPTFFDDLPLSQQPALDTSILTTSNIQAETYLEGRVNRYLRIERSNGVIYRKVLDKKLIYDANGDPVAMSLYLNQSIGSSAGSNLISKISFAPITRLNSDVVTLQHSDIDTILSIDIRTINE